MLGRRTLQVVGIIALCVSSYPAAASDASPWNGVWTGTFGKSSKISVTIADNKATGYSYRGAKLDVAYSKAGKDTFSFGDAANYSMLLKRTSDGAVRATYHGRHGFIAADLVRQ
jgi:hypothetical protein